MSLHILYVYVTIKVLDLNKNTNKDNVMKINAITRKPYKVGPTQQRPTEGNAGAAEAQVNHADLS